MIYSYRNLINSSTLECDICVIGSGAGGSALATKLAKSGKSVIIVEYGSFFRPSDFTQRENEMFPKLFYDGGGRRTQNKAIRVLHGHGVGGSTLHNINLCKRLPNEILKEWNISGLSSNRISKYFDTVEKDLGVSQIEESSLNQNNLLFKKGVEKLGWKGGILSHNRKGCLESGFCELGCSFNAKMNALRVYIPEFIKNGGKVLSNSRAISFNFNQRKIKSVNVEVLDPHSKEKLNSFKIEAKTFVSSAGAIEGPLLLQRSEIPDPFKQVGQGLRLHPGAIASGLFEESVEAWMGIPQSYECTEYIDFTSYVDKRAWLVGGSAHPVGVSSLMPGWGKDHRTLMKNYPHLATVTPMIHDISTGQVSSRLGGGVQIDYKLNQLDRDQFEIGLRAAAKILFAAGAREVFIPGREFRRFKSLSGLYAAKFPIRDHEIEFMAVHPMSTLAMGENIKTSNCDKYGKYHHLDNLFVADTSLFPTSIGVPPQISTYSFGHYIADQIKEYLN